MNKKYHDIVEYYFDVYEEKECENFIKTADKKYLDAIFISGMITLKNKLIDQLKIDKLLGKDAYTKEELAKIIEDIIINTEKEG